MKAYFLRFSELIVILAVFLVVDSYLEPQEVLIKADGKGYYDYLPATFIYNDLNFNYTDTLQTEYYNHKEYSQSYLHEVNGQQINKYFPGAAVLWIPFFYGAHGYALVSDYPPDGYSYPYQIGVYVAALFYLWLGLFFFRKVLAQKKVPYWIIFILQLVFAIGTPILNYVHFDASFVHVYSFCLINAFVYYLFKYLDTQVLKNAWIAGLILGLIFLVRPVNVMAVLLVFLGFNSLGELKNAWAVLKNKRFRPVLYLVIGFTLVASWILVLWKFQTGHFFIWGYQGESFNFLSPTVFNFLFSSRKGLFIHTPVLGLMLGVGLVTLFRAKKNYSILTYVLVSYLIVYVLSSWWSWYYGTSFGSRPSIDFYIVLGLWAGQSFETMKSKWSQWIYGFVLVIFIPVNVIQAYQYQNYIMDWDQMTFEKFGFIRLHTEKKYRGVFFRPHFAYQKLDVVWSDSLKLSRPIFIGENGKARIYFEKINNGVELSHPKVHIQLKLEIESGNSDLILKVIDAFGNIVSEKRSNTFGALKAENVIGMGDFYFSLDKIPANARLELEMESGWDQVKVNAVKLAIIKG